jgi:hypothetical protein
VPVWYVAPLEMNVGTHWGQGYNQPTTGCSAEERPNKRPLTLTFGTSIAPLLKLYDPKLHKANLKELWRGCVGWSHMAGSW